MGFDRQASYIERQSKLVPAAASAPDNRRLAPRLDLARFYFAREMYPEAKAVLDTAIADERRHGAGPAPLVLRAVAKIMLGRPDDALKDLANPVVGNQNDAPLWRALASPARANGRQARDAFRERRGRARDAAARIAAVALKDALRARSRSATSPAPRTGSTISRPSACSAEVEPGDVGADRPAGRGDRPPAGRARGLSRRRPSRTTGGPRRRAGSARACCATRWAISSATTSFHELETLTTAWRGDETEVEALQMLARLYTAEGRYRDAFHVMRVALPRIPIPTDAQHPAGSGPDLRRAVPRRQGRRAAGDRRAGLFYDFRELTPIGRRGDEMIRRLAERLVSVDLLDQAAELLQYQVDNRLQGAARAQVATRLAVIYLMNRKADRAQATLRATRTADLTNEVRNPRLMIEARALSDIGRHDFALEVIAGLDGREVLRLRSDIYWAARRWREAAEQIELLYGDRWKDSSRSPTSSAPTCCAPAARYALAEDKLGLGRSATNTRPKWPAGPTPTPSTWSRRRSAPAARRFGAIAHAAAAVDTLDGFLRDMQARYPDASASPPSAAQPAPPDAPPASAVPPIPSIVPPTRASGRTALR